MTTFEISIHALREEGDAPSGRNTPDTPNFYPRPPRGGRLEGAVHGIKTKDFYPRPPRGGRRVSGLVGASPTYFYPRPPRGGRQLARRLQGVQQGFLSTPSARRATGDVDRVEATIDISIHALREEGDDLPCSRYLEIQDFYPRPPRGGRQGVQLGDYHTLKFLSTPSARRATQLSHHSPSMTANFYPRPPRGGRHLPAREENQAKIFLSTPSARRATLTSCEKSRWRKISIHALREEGDDKTSLFERFQIISIHALREEGDLRIFMLPPLILYFYPRPPRGGRPPSILTWFGPPSISIHALREEGDANSWDTLRLVTISIHALREEGDF